MSGARHAAAAADRRLHPLGDPPSGEADLLVQEYGRYFGLRTGCFRCGCITGGNHAAAEQHGFVRGSKARTGVWDYADIDDDFISLHHWLKWFKFGFTRTFDNLSVDIRNGRLTREHAIQILRERGDETPREDIARFCAWAGITEARFFEIAETFRNHDVWTKRADGTWKIDDFIVPDWAWTPRGGT